MSGSPPRVAVLGGGIAGLAAAWRLACPGDGREPVRTCLIEGSPRLGGKILTEEAGDFLIEAGPDAFLTRKPEMLELVRELGLEESLLGSNDGERGTYVVHRGRLVELPEGLERLVPARREDLLRSPILSRRGKERLLAEPEVPPRRESGDESLADFVRRRFGREVLERLAEPILAHIHVADAERMSLEATYPHLAALERHYGSVARGVEAARARAAAAPGGPSPIFRTFRDGLGELVGALHRRLEREAEVVTGDPAVALRHLADGDGYAVRLRSGRELVAAAVALALPAGAAARLLEGLDRDLARRLRGIPYVSIATVSLGYRRGASAPPPGFGFFVPRGEGRRVLACTFSSSKFERRAPEGGTLLRAFLGGAAGEETLALDDDELVRAVEEDLDAILGLGGVSPALRRLHRFPNGYPQYEVGHLERVRALRAALPPGLALAGSAYDGVGLPDCIRSSYAAAERAVEAASKRASALVRG